MNGFVASDEVIIVTDAETFSINNLDLFLDNIRTIQQDGNDRLNVLGIVINKVDSRRGLTKVMVNDLRRSFGDVIFKTYISYGTAIPTSLHQQIPLRKLKWWGRSTTQMMDLTGEVVERMVLLHGDGAAMEE